MNKDITPAFKEVMETVKTEPEEPEIVINAGNYIASTGMSIPVIIRTQRGGMIERLWNEELKRRQALGAPKLDDPNVIDVEAEVMTAEEEIGQTKQSTIDDKTKA